ncbi:uncharacterized protein BDZ99DRAFT_472580 [Mytilinidion resinicola]|uniref:Zn(2)-C6 fungal-type domain-containing protein n=1 Tax=Mytilinidion resinicola TaxID=574789 RepID=A0A6A6Z381_9PEZI|nr:uncharacterized protein BDZ99DRAFT_472580 [Mytilinidion resinicola]KAF2815278.1 hypothetical protein BDZ99DRAFT_472580 [Mytilinidion resinicola]
MGFTGKPSRGCGVCRRRRIKCDEASPGCSYCLKRQIVCPGYRSQFDVAWRNQNVVAEHAVLRRKKAIDKADRDGAAKTQVERHASLRIPKSLPQDYEQYAINFFLSSYILLPKDPGVRRGMLDCLYPVWTRIDSTSPLKPALTAVASCMLEGWSRLRPDISVSLSRSHYVKGVAALREALEENKDIGDDVLLASLMLDMYEEVVSFMTGTRSFSPHVRGTTSLIAQRRRRPVTNKTSQRVLLGARSQIVTRVLANAQPAPFDPSEWREITPNILETPVLILDDLNIDVANIHAAASCLNSETTQRDLAWEILQRTIELDQRLLAWTSSTAPIYWMPVRVAGPECIPQGVRDAGLYHDYCHVHQSIFIAATLNVYYTSRIKLQLAILNCLKHLDFADSDATRLTTLEIIQDLADNVCASVPFHLGDRREPTRIDDKDVQYPHTGGDPVSDHHYAAAAAYGGYLLTRPLVEVLTARCPLRTGQREWIGGQMQRLKQIYAIRPI